jgi:hypothetical protein
MRQLRMGQKSCLDELHTPMGLSPHLPDPPSHRYDSGYIGSPPRGPRAPPDAQIPGVVSRQTSILLPIGTGPATRTRPSRAGCSAVAFRASARSRSRPPPSRSSRARLRQTEQPRLELGRRRDAHLPGKEKGERPDPKNEGAYLPWLCAIVYWTVKTNVRRGSWVLGSCNARLCGDGSRGRAPSATWRYHRASPEPQIQLAPRFLRC